MGNPLPRKKAADQKFKDAKKAANSIRKQAGKKGPRGIEQRLMNTIADAVEEGLVEVKLPSGQKVSLNTPEVIEQVVKDVLEGKYK
jgi:hypothetical protein